jgi:two-component system chemotaxis response regulator CheB
MSVFARQLSVAAGRETVVAEDGLALTPDLVVVAPGDAHLTVDKLGERVVIRLTRERVRSGCMPSVDPMLASIGAAYGKTALGVVLTGMGRDGVDGATKLVACGGSVLAQDEASSAVWGMPRTILEAGLACAVMPPDKIARRVASRTEASPCR